MESHHSSSRKITKYFHHLQSIEEDEIAKETAFTISINSEQYATIVCTPTHIREMVVGFLASEAVILSFNQIESLTIDHTLGFVYVELGFSVDFSERSERWIGSCCGKSREFYFKQDVKTARTIMKAPQISSGQVVTLMATFDQMAATFVRTGGVHQASLTDGENILCSFIDIGRHNALDKLFGFILENSVSMQDKCILFSGRISSEVILKVAKIGCGILLAKSAPTDLALKLADDLNITAVGFIRDNKMNVYSHESRILGDEQQYLSK